MASPCAERQKRVRPSRAHRRYAARNAFRALSERFILPIPGACAHCGLAAQVTKKAWFTQWVSKCLGYIKEASLNGVKNIQMLQIKPDIEDDKTFARQEWPELKRLLEECYKREADEVRLIPFDDIDWAECPSVIRLPEYLKKQVDQDTCVIVASCPGSKMQEVQDVIMQFKQQNKYLQAHLNLAYSQKEGANAWLGTC